MLTHSEQQHLDVVISAEVRYSGKGDFSLFLVRLTSHSIQITLHSLVKDDIRDPNTSTSGLVVSTAGLSSGSVVSLSISGHLDHNAGYCNNYGGPFHHS